MDQEGNSNWPNTKVSTGGVFHLPKVTYSKETHDFLKCKISCSIIESFRHLLCILHAHFEKKTLSSYNKYLLIFEVLMEEQKMTILQRNRINSFLRSGNSLPLPKPTRATTTNCRPGIDFMRASAARRRTLQAIKASGAMDRDR